MKNAMKRIVCMMIAVMLLISAVPAAFAADGDAELKIVVKINGEATNKPKTVTVTDSVSLTKDYGMSLLSNKENRSVDGWTKADGTAIAEGHAIRAEWLKTEAPEGYYVVLNINETKPEPTPTPDAEQPISVPVNIYVNGEYMRTTSISVPVNGSVTLSKDYGMDLLKTTADRSCEKWTSTHTDSATDNVLSYGWLKNDAPANYELNLYIKETKTEQKPAEDNKEEDTTADSGVRYIDEYGYLHLAFSGKANQDPYNVKLNVYIKNSNGNGITYSEDYYINTLASTDSELTITEVRNLLKNYYNSTSSTDGFEVNGIYEYVDNFNSAWAENTKKYERIYNLDKARNDKEITLAVVLKNAKLKSSAAVDKTNPKTGDDIMIAVTTMALAGAALVSVAELKKRKMI